MPRNTCAKAASFLTSGYRNEFFYWETVELGRRLLVSGWVLLIPTQEMFLRLISALLVSILFLVLTAVARPWSRAEDNMLALVSQGALVIALGCCLVIKIINSPCTVNEELDKRLGFPDAAVPYFVLCFVALGFLFVMVALFAATVHRGFSSLISHQASGSVGKSTSTAFSLGACLLGLPAGALGGYIFGVPGGVVGSAVFGILGAVLGVAVGKMLRHFAKKAVQKLIIRRKVGTDEMLETGLQDFFDELVARPVLKRRRSIHSMDKAILNRLSSGKSRLKETEAVEGSHSRAEGDDSVDDRDTMAGKHVRKHLNSISRLISRKEAVELLTTAANRIREPSYSLTHFHSDMVKCFPELQLYLGGNEPAADTVQASATILKNKGVFLAGASPAGPAASSGRTGHVEYCRTFGALFCVYWLMRLELDEVDGSQGLGGQIGFCFGVDAVTWEATPLPLQQEHPLAAGAVAPTEESKKRAFLLSHNWKQMHELMVDAGLLTRTESGGVAVCVDRTRAMLVLTAIHDVTDRFLEPGKSTRKQTNSSHPTCASCAVRS